MKCYVILNVIQLHFKRNETMISVIQFFSSILSFLCVLVCASLSLLFALTRVCCIQVFRLSLCFGQLSISRVSITQQSAANIMYRSNIVPHFKIGDRSICALECRAEVKFYRHVWSVAFFFEHLKRIFFSAPKNSIKYLPNQCEHSSNCIYVYCVQLRRSQLCQHFTRPYLFEFNAAVFTFRLVSVQHHHHTTTTVNNNKSKGKLNGTQDTKLQCNGKNRIFIVYFGHSIW